jgi:hypothetical protein
LASGENAQIASSTSDVAISLRPSLSNRVKRRIAPSNPIPIRKLLGISM